MTRVDVCQFGVEFWTGCDGVEANEIPARNGVTTRFRTVMVVFQAQKQTLVVLCGCCA